MACSGETAQAVDNRLVADLHYTGGFTHSSAVGHMIENHLIVEAFRFNIVVQAEGLLAKPSATAEAFEAGDRPLGQGLVAAGDVVPTPGGRWLCVIITFGMGTKKGG
ncbi:MAG: hypothetical protein U5P10_05065 [Spirochaetia bacterium]|nr:hypothetical protein [Spirochaetia bacterium]